MNIYFPNVGRRCELVEAFAKAILAVEPGLIWGSDPNSLAPALQVVDRVVELPVDIDSDLFLEELIKFIIHEKIDLIIPTIDPDLDRFDRWRNSINEAMPSTRLLIPSSEVIRTSRNKILSRDKFRDLGARVPEPVEPHSSYLEFPVFIKPSAGSGSVGACKISTRAELDLKMATTTDPMIEKVVDGDEITVDVLLDFSSKPLCAVPRRRIQTRGGEVTRGVVERNKELEGLASDLTAKLGCTGPVTIQFRNPSPGVWVAMELNARMGGGLPLTIAAGADWPKWILELHVGRKPKIETANITDGLILTRADRSYFLLPAYHSVVPRLDRINYSLPKHIIFDLDDTLYPEIQFVISGYRAVAEKVWRDYKLDIEGEIFQRLLKGQRGDLMTAALLSAGITIPATYVEQVLVPCYRNHLPILTPFLGVMDTIEALRNSGRTISMVTDGIGSVQRRKIQALKLAPYFDSIVINDDFGREAWKPSLHGYLKTMENLKGLPEDSVYVADNPAKDFFAPNKMGMKSIRVKRIGTEHFNGEPVSDLHKPDFYINSIPELLLVL